MTSRLDAIRNLLLTQKKVQVNELSEKFQISTVTIRKDLALLEEEGVAQRIYGGAVLAETVFPATFDVPQDGVRALLAERACDEISDGDSIFLGSGRTCCCLAKRLSRFQNLSVVTNNITALGDLLKSNARVYLLGGEVTSTDAYTLFSSPENPHSFTDHIFVSKAFTSISGIDLHAGLTVNSIVSTHIYRNLPSITRSWYLMADSSKFDQIAMYPVAGLDAVSCLITDRLPDSYQETIRENGVTVRLTDTHYLRME